MGLFDSLFGKKKATQPQPSASPTQEPEPEGDENWEDMGTPQEMNPEEVQKLLDSENPPVLLDVREEPELEADGFIPGSIHIPMTELESKTSELDLSKPYVVYCASGMRSFDAGFFLIENGCKEVSNLNGGIKAWQGEIERK